MKTVTPRELNHVKGRLVDVRNLDEFAAERLPGAECVPLSGLLSAAGDWDRKERLILMCKSGIRSGQAAEQLQKVGFSDLVMLEGGIEACKKAGLEVIVDRRRLPMQRQVLLGSGLFLLSGLVLALVNPWFLAIDWFAASMMVVAGVTGFCPMAEVLKRMPWNAQGKCSSCAA